MDESLSYDSLPAFLESASALVAGSLPELLPRQEPDGFLYGLVRDYPSRGGKRFRPALMLLCAALAGADGALASQKALAFQTARALPTALALELFHNFALVHDDIEDGSLLRRGQPTLHRTHGVPLALNAGDTLFALVYEALERNTDCLGESLAGQVRREVQTVIRKTLEGQGWDIGWVATGHWPSRPEYQIMIQHKTGWYSGRGPCRIGALVGGAAPELVHQLGDFGECLGIGFQVRDDLLNLAPDTSERIPGDRGPGGEGYGKERGGDIAEGKRTLIVIELMERLPPTEGDTLRDILSRPPAQTDTQQVEWVIQRAEETGALAAVEQHCEALGQKAHEALTAVPPSPQREILRQMVDYLVLRRAG